MKPKCELNLNICCLDCNQCVLDVRSDKLVCNVEGCEYCGFEWYRKNACDGCPYDEEDWL